MSYDNLIQEIDRLSVRVSELLADAELLRSDAKRLNKVNAELISENYRLEKELNKAKGTQL